MELENLPGHECVEGPARLGTSRRSRDGRPQRRSRRRDRRSRPDPKMGSVRVVSIEIAVVLPAPFGPDGAVDRAIGKLLVA